VLAVRGGKGVNVSIFTQRFILPLRVSVKGSSSALHTPLAGFCEVDEQDFNKGVEVYII
jgi:hypothetical protein